jgi:hypothetical protein
MMICARSLNLTFDSTFGSVIDTGKNTDRPFFGRFSFVPVMQMDPVIFRRKVDEREIVI